MATYSGNGDSNVREYLKNIGFSDNHIYSNNYGGSLAFTVAVKDYNGEFLNHNLGLLVIVAQGSTNPYELFQDIFTGWGERINNYEAYDIVRDFYKDIFDGINLMVDPNKTYKVLVTGHSLGGAAANLVAARLTRGYYGQENVYGYTFGAIDSIHTDGLVYFGYENIHNITNYYDSFGPNGWAFNTAKGNTRYGKFGHIDMFFTDIDQGKPGARDNHGMAEAYLPAVKQGLVRHDYSGDQKIIGWHCPVDVKIYRNGELVGVVTNNKVIREQTSVPLVVEDDVKYLAIVDDAEYTFEVTATGSGVMKLEIVNAGTSETIRQFESVLLEPEKQFISEISEEIRAENVQLFVVDETGAQVREVREDGNEAFEDGTLYGDANGDGKVNAADAAMLLRTLVRLSKFNANAMKNADLNGDGAITAEDALEILRFVIR